MFMLCCGCCIRGLGPHTLVGHKHLLLMWLRCKPRDKSPCKKAVHRLLNNAILVSVVACVRCVRVADQYPILPLRSFITLTIPWTGGTAGYLGLPGWTCINPSLTTPTLSSIYCFIANR